MLGCPIIYSSLKKEREMKEIECLREGTKQDEYLKKLFSKVSMAPKFINWGDSKYSKNNPLVLIASEEHLDELMEICEGRDLKVIIGLNARKDFKLVGKLKSHFNIIFGFIDLSQEIDYNTPILINYLNLNFSSHAVKLDQLARDLDKIFEFTQSELLKVKDLHDRLIKVRVDTLKGITVTSKFMAGEKSGGEFFDMVQKDHDFLFILAGSDHYIVSSLILSEIEVLKQTDPTVSLKEQSDHFIKMVTKYANENKASLDYCIVNINLKTLKTDCSFKGEGYLYYQNQLIDFLNPCSMVIKPTEKFYFLSSGAIKNLKLLNPNLSLLDFYRENHDKNTQDLINEFFFEVSRNKSGTFLVYDALMNVIEVDRNTLYEIN